MSVNDLSMTAPETPTRGAYRWSRVEYEHIVNLGGFPPEARLELLDGEIIDMSPQKSQHAAACDLAEAALRTCDFGAAYVRTQKPLALDDRSEPEPDLAVVPGTPRDYADAHPDHALLIVEVADSSLGYDRTRKAGAYARNGVPEYWIINLRERVLEVRRGPVDGVYSEHQRLAAYGQVRPIAAPGCQIAVQDLLP